MLNDTITYELFRNTEIWKGHGEIFLSDPFWMIRGFNIRGREFLFPAQPYLLQERRVVWVKKGWAVYAFNLVEHRFEAGNLVVFYGDTLVEKKGCSADFEFDAFRYDSLLENPPVPPTEAPEGADAEPPSFIRLPMDESCTALVAQHFALLWDLVRQEPFPRENAALLVRSLLLCAVQRYGQAPAPQPLTRQQETLQRFVALVSRFAVSERNIPFYADKLCIAPHYLSTLVKQMSGRTVMDWINETAVKAVKVWLAYSDETAAQIAERLRFPCPASLTKFFKRATGMTPGQYRAEHKGAGGPSKTGNKLKSIIL